MKYLDNSSVSCSLSSQQLVIQNASTHLPHTSSLEDLSLPRRPIRERQGNDFIVAREFDLSNQVNRSVGL